MIDLQSFLWVQGPDEYVWIAHIIGDSDDRIYAAALRH